MCKCIGCIHCRDTVNTCLDCISSMAVTTMAGCGSAGGSAKYPSKDISVIIPKAAGGGTDTAARGLMQYMKYQKILMVLQYIRMME